MSSAAGEILREVRSRGVKLWTEDGELRYQAPKGTLTASELQRLRSLKGEIVSYLEATRSARLGMLKLEPRPSGTEVPLTYSQLTHWQSTGLGSRPSLRQVATAIRLRGPLDIERLRVAALCLARRHESLRTSIVQTTHGLRQKISDAAHIDLRFEDLSELAGAEQPMEVQRRFNSFILEPVDLTLGPLWGILIVRLAFQEHVLLVAMEHNISDATSVHLVLRELLLLYGSPSQALPALPIQYADYAVWQQQSRDGWVKLHGSYWEQRLTGAERVRFPGTRSEGIGPRGGRAMAPLRIEPQVKTELLDWCRARRTTLAISVFTAYVALVLRSCAVSDAVFRYQIDGRSRPELRNAIGYLASILHLRVQLDPNDTLLDLLARVTREYCSAYEHADDCYIDAQLPKPAFCRNTTFNWVPQSYERDVLDGTNADALEAGEVYPFTNPVLDLIDKDSEPMVLLFDMDDAVVGGLYFDRNRFEPEVMAGLAREFARMIHLLMTAPQTRVADIVTLF